MWPENNSVIYSLGNSSVHIAISIISKINSDRVCYLLANKQVAHRKHQDKVKTKLILNSIRAVRRIFFFFHYYIEYVLNLVYGQGHMKH